MRYKAGGNIGPTHFRIIEDFVRSALQLWSEAKTFGDDRKLKEYLQLQHPRTEEVLQDEVHDREEV